MPKRSASRFSLSFQGLASQFRCQGRLPLFLLNFQLSTSLSAFCLKCLIRGSFSPKAIRGNPQPAHFFNRPIPFPSTYSHIIYIIAVNIVLLFRMISCRESRRGRRHPGLFCSATPPNPGRLSPLKCAVPRFRPVTPLECALTKGGYVPGGAAFFSAHGHHPSKRYFLHCPTTTPGVRSAHYAQH